MKKLSSIIFLIAAMLTGTAYADEPIAQRSEPSEAYIKYMELPEEERKNYIEPFPVDIKPVESSISTFTLLPSSYNSHDEGFDVAVRNQNPTGTCWAFAANTNLSMFLKKQAIENGNAVTDDASITFSPRHMEQSLIQNPKDVTNEWAFGSSYYPTGRTIDEGGNSYMASAYYTRGSGPVLEKNMPFINDTSTYEPTANIYQPTAARVLDYKFIPYINTDTNGEIDISSEAVSTQMNAIRDEIKQAIYNNGSAVVNYYSAKVGYKNADDSYSYFYCPTIELQTDSSGNSIQVNKPNHAVTAIGWDDNYSADNFNSDRKPENNGAFLIQNSWGENWGENGLFYISYDELSLYLGGASTVINAEAQADYDNRYVLDPLGWNNSLYYQYASGDYVTDIYGINVFYKSEGTEELTEITIGNNGNDSFDIWVNTFDGQGFQAVVTDGIFTHSGYTTITLNSPILLENTRFDIKLRYHDDFQARLPIEEYLTYGYSTAAAEIGTSYNSPDGNHWYETSNFYDGYANCSIKAFTKNVSPKTKISFVKDNPNLIVDIIDNQGLKLTPNADGTFWLSENAEYHYFAKAKTAGAFTVSGDNKKLYTYINPDSINTAAKKLDNMLVNYGQNETLQQIKENLEIESGSHIHLDDNLTITPPDDLYNGTISGTVTITDTNANKTEALTYNNNTIYKAQITRENNQITVTGNSDTEGSVYVAGYNNGILLGVKSFPVSLKEGTASTHDEPVIANATTTKVFLWADGRMYPCAEVK